MKFITDYPVRSDLDGQWIAPATMTDLCRHLEGLGLDGLGVTDHPAPSRKWLDNGGHEAFDPFAVLSYFAAVTERMSLFTHLLVLPYRNPLLQVSGMASLDVLSGGRAVFVLGTGYLRSEFAALGVEFDDRNDLFDEAIEVIRRTSTGEPLNFEGRTFTALDQVVLPGYIQRPHPPLWLGGNSSRVLDRLAAWGQGWSVMMGSAELSRTARTPVIATPQDLARALADLKTRAEQHGRSLADITVQASTPVLSGQSGASPEQRIQAIGELADLGVSWVNVDLWTDSIEESKDLYQEFQETVMARV
ncbi:MAG: TIGR03619 family F420-dependent LLM class oxidoreductase [Candidatus Nanopelagicales bacterium]|nr:TIGR03619 family F420-dependent LLM class oxidoreductase [Candidatus Nanopelagicales bacterium]